MSVTEIKELGHKLLVGDAAEIRRLVRRRQKKDRRYAELLLDLLLHDEFPTLFHYAPESRELWRQLRYRHKSVKLRTTVANSLHGHQCWSQSAGATFDNFLSTMFASL